jgi:hypothetical protein
MGEAPKLIDLDVHNEIARREDLLPLRPCAIRSRSF